MRGFHVFSGSSRARTSTKKKFALAAACALALAATQVSAQADLTGSNFESNDGNLVNNAGGAPFDWENAPNRVRQDDLPSGGGDNSFGQGTKEDDLTPTVVDGSIPPNKSDLTRFYVANEKGTNNHQFIYLAWERTNTLGSANMDFEINQAAQPDLTTLGTKSLNRTAGDLLILFDFSGGGTTATLRLVKWLTAADGAVAGDCKANNALPCWGAKPADDALDGINDNTIDLSAAGFADGAVNVLCGGAKQCNDTTPDPIAGVSLPTATFGEAAVDLTAAGVFPPGECLNFGSAYLKSRSSDSFNAETKDFVAPAEITINNCGNIVIRKVTDPSPDPTDTSFDFTLTGGPSNLNEAFSLKNGESNDTAGKDVLAGDGYSAAETVPAGWELISATCDDGSPVTNIDVSVGETVTCTFTNRARGSITIVKQTADGQGAFDFTSNTLSPASWTLTTTGPGAAGQDSRDFTDLSPGTYDAAETVPAFWNLDSSTCDDGSAVSAIGVSPGEHVTCTFVNSRERGAIDITKLRKHAADGPGDHPHPGVTFTVTGGELPAAGVDVVTDANGNACLGNLVVSGLVGDYTVTETVPAGYHNVDVDGATRTGVVVSESTCASGATALTFHNMPLTNITVSVDSQVDGGTSSTIDCTPLDPNGDDATTGANGDGSHTVSDLEPGTYTCEVTIDP